MGRRRDLVGQRFGRWVVLVKDARRIGAKSSYWVCACDCGTIKTVVADTLVKGQSRSCGCLRAETAGDKVRTHGMTKTHIYSIWFHMRERCRDKNRKYYAGRGIRVCERWESFEYFLADMKLPPGEEYTLDRINPNGMYEPGNVVWATRTEQQNNRRNTVKISCQGKTLTIPQWSRETGIPMHVLRQRLKRGWTIEDTITIPVNSLYWPKMTPLLMEDILKLYKEGHTATKISRLLSLNYTTVKRVIEGKHSISNTPH